MMNEEESKHTLFFQHHAVCVDTDATLMLRAAAEGRVGTVSALLDKGVNIDAHDMMGRTALWFASNGNREGVVALLLKRGANVDRSDKFDCTPFYVASDIQCLSIMELLHRAGADVNRQSGSGGHTALHVAAYHRNIRMLNMLLGDEKTDPDVVNLDNNTPLAIAVERGFPEIVEALLRRCNVNAAGSDGWTALHSAASTCRVEMLRLLIRRGACVEGVGVCNASPLWISCFKNDLASIRYLVEEAGADVLVSDKDTGHSVASAATEDACVLYLKRAIESLKFGEESVDGVFACPLSSVTLRDPVSLSCGHNFERGALRRYLVSRKDAVCPQCGSKVPDTEWSVRYKPVNKLFQRAYRLIKS